MVRENKKAWKANYFTKVVVSVGESAEVRLGQLDDKEIK